MSEMTPHPKWRVPEFTLADRLRKARETTGLDQATFADEIGIARNSVNNYERGHTTPRPIVLKAWALRTGAPVEWLRTGLLPSTTHSGDGDATPEQHSPVAQLAEHPTVNRRVAELECPNPPVWHRQGRRPA